MWNSGIIPHRQQIFTGLKCAYGIFLQAKKNKHLTPAIFGGVPFSWRATWEANKQFRKHANFQYTAKNRIATFCWSFGVWLTIWKANKGRT